MRGEDEEKKRQKGKGKNEVGRKSGTKSRRIASERIGLIPQP